MYKKVCTLEGKRRLYAQNMFTCTMSTSLTVFEVLHLLVYENQLYLWISLLFFKFNYRINTGAELQPPLARSPPDFRVNMCYFIYFPQFYYNTESMEELMQNMEYEGTLYSVLFVWFTPTAVEKLNMRFSTKSITIPRDFVSYTSLISIPSELISIGINLLFDKNVTFSNNFFIMLTDNTSSLSLTR